MADVLSYLLWPAICTVPLVMTTNKTYASVFSSDQYVEEPTDYWYNLERAWPSPVGLSLGLLTVVVGQIFVCLYIIGRRSQVLGSLVSIQKVGPRPYDIMEGLKSHFFQPEGFLLLGGYLSITWMCGLMPPSYYSFAGGVNWLHVALQLIITDGVQYAMHYAEHKASAWIYQQSHKPHHRFTNPRLFDAFNGSPADTTLMILIPLVIAARLVPANVWSYMAFGSLYANWLTLIHAEYVHPWDPLFRLLGLGTAADHHVHHKLFVFNYGHLFMWWDRAMGTYKDPANVPAFNKGV